MKKNKIDGIKAFSDFPFKSCYYHQLISGLSCFGIDKDVTLLNAFVVIGDGFSLNKDGLLNEKEFGKLAGFRRVHCNINKRKLLKCIDGGHPVIVGVDCFYLESRADYYHSNHVNHFILAYGYDLGEGTANVVDHNYLNSYEYIEKEISLDNLLFANRMLKDGILNKKHTCYVLKPARERENPDILSLINEKLIRNNKLKSLSNWNEIRRMMTDNPEKLCEKADTIAAYLSDLRTLYFTLSKTKLFSAGEQRENVSLLTSGYSNILSVFWKIGTQKRSDFVARKSENIMRKIDGITESERKLYDYLLEVKKDETVYPDRSERTL
ncbi:MAG: BtrH N-terminal domain-containing protein [Christensenellales bacterium]